jgi:NAD+ diphosphatase
MLAEAPVHGRGLKPPPPNVLEPFLPAARKGWRHAAGLRRCVELRKAPLAVSLGRVSRETRVLDDVGPKFVDLRDRVPQRRSQTRTRFERREVEAGPADLLVDHGPTALGQRGRARGPRNRERKRPGIVLARKLRQKAQFGFQGGAGRRAARGPHHPALSRRVHDDHDVEVDVRVWATEDVIHVEPRDGGRRESRESERRMGHDLTVEPNGGEAPRTAARGGYREGMYEPWPLAERPLLDRAADRRGTADLDGADAVLVAGGSVLVRDGRLVILPAAQRPSARATFSLGRVDGVEVVGIVPDGDLPTFDGAEMTLLWGAFRDLREPAPRLDWELGATAVAMATWHERAAYCPVCGSPTEPINGGWARRCTREGVEHYPRTDPAVIVAITDPDDRLLLAHVSYHSPRRYSHLAGYVEPGESLEQAAHREVMEEAGIALGGLEYLGSQPWPFPASIMIGFAAKATTTEIVVDGEEVTDAVWLTRLELLERVAEGEMILAPPGSIARHMIHSWYGGPVADAQGVSST